MATTDKLNLDQAKISQARSLAKNIADSIQGYINRNTTTTIERTTLRLFGVKGVDEDQTPLVNVIVDSLGDKLGGGISTPFLSAAAKTGKSAIELAEAICSGQIDMNDYAASDAESIYKVGQEFLAPQLDRIKQMRKIREEKISAETKKERPLLYVIVATGNIHEDVLQARRAAIEGADIIAVIRATAQSLLDYVPYGLTTEGFGGTYATQENFELMRAALDEVGDELGRYVRLVNYASGLCMPEIAAMGAMERLDMMLNDSMYGILFRDINMYRTFCDQHFSRMINAYAGITINTGEDNYLTTADAIEAADTVLASDLINEQFALNSGLSPKMMGLGHAYEIQPEIENSFLLELSQALLLREVFPEHPLKYMPPTKHMTGDIFRTYMVNAMFNMVGQWTGQGIQLLGMLTEALHTPFLQDRYLAIKNAEIVMSAVKDIGNEVFFKDNGIVKTRAKDVLDKTVSLLEEVSETGLMESIANGRFAEIKRAKDGGKGLVGVAPKTDDYYNPVLDVFKKELDAVID